jgi:hypothetical protein
VLCVCRWLETQGVAFIGGSMGLRQFGNTHGGEKTIAGERLIFYYFLKVDFRNSLLSFLRGSTI